MVLDIEPKASRSDMTHSRKVRSLKSMTLLFSSTMLDLFDHEFAFYAIAYEFLSIILCFNTASMYPMHGEYSISHIKIPGKR